MPHERRTLEMGVRPQCERDVDVRIDHEACAPGLLSIDCCAHPFGESRRGGRQCGAACLKRRQNLL